MKGNTRSMDSWTGTIHFRDVTNQEAEAHERSVLCQSLFIEFNFSLGYQSLVIKVFSDLVK